MSRVYYAPIAGVATPTGDADWDVFELIAGAAKPVQILGIKLASTFASSGPVSFRFVRRSTTGSGGTGVTVVPADSSGSSTGTTVNRMVTTTGTIGDILAGDVWHQNTLEYIYLPTPELQILVPGGGRFALNCTTNIGSAYTWSGHLALREWG